MIGLWLWWTQRRNRCPRACSEGHTYQGRCRAKLRDRQETLEGAAGFLYRWQGRERR